MYDYDPRWIILDNSFISNVLPSLAGAIPNPVAAQYVSFFRRNGFLLDLFSNGKEAVVDIAVKVNVVAMCAVFVFLGAILLGAF